MNAMRCPRCGFEQAPADECARCGVLVARVHERPAPAAAAAAPGARVGGLAAVVPILGFFAATAALIVFLRPHAPGTARGGAPQAGSGWYEGAEGYRRADEERRRDRKPMAVYFHTDWCGWCKKLESGILADDWTRRYLDGVVKVRINPEDGEEEERLARGYGVRGYPTFLIVSSLGGGGREIHPFRVDGAMSPSEFVAECRKAE